MTCNSNGQNRVKLCALIAALQHEPMSVESLQQLSGLTEAAVRSWLRAFEAAKLASPAGFGPKLVATGCAPMLWAWRFA